jgi:hypothetical protein
MMRHTDAMIIRAIINLDKGVSISGVCKKYHISRSTLYRWRSFFDAPWTKDFICERVSSGWTKFRAMSEWMRMMRAPIVPHAGDADILKKLNELKESLKK